VLFLTNPTNEWIKVIGDPLGLTGFVLFLVFGLLAKVKRRDERRWLFPAVLVMALIALFGGLSLAYLRTRPSTSPPTLPQSTSASQQQTNQVQQTSSGEGSPNVQGVEGGVTITIDQSSGKTTKPGTKAAQEKSPIQQKTK